MIHIAVLHTRSTVLQTEVQYLSNFLCGMLLFRSVMMDFSSFISRMALSQSCFSAHARRYLHLM